MKRFMEQLKKVLKDWLLYIELPFVTEPELYDRVNKLDESTIEEFKTIVKNFIFVSTNAYIEKKVNEQLKDDIEYYWPSHSDKVRGLLDLYNALDLFLKQERQEKIKKV